jgi:hypothetical protein
MLDLPVGATLVSRAHPSSVFEFGSKKIPAVWILGRHETLRWKI